MSYEEAPLKANGQDPQEAMFEALVKLHRPELTRYAARQLGEHANLAEDVVQESLLNAHRAILGGICPEHPRAWLFTIVRNATVNAARAARPTERIEERQHGTTDQTVPAAVEQSEWIDWLMGAVGELPVRQRDALVGHAFEGRSYHEIAARQQTTVSAVKSLIGRARRALSADTSVPAVGIGAPFAAGARGLRILLARSPFAGKAGGLKGLAGVLAQAALAATVTTGVLMVVHGGPSTVLASAGPPRAPHTGEHHARPQASAPRHRSETKRALERRVHREGHRAIRACMHGAGLRHYGEAGLQYAVQHLTIDALEYTDCDRLLRSAAVRAAVRRRRSLAGSYQRHRRRAGRDAR